MLCFSFLDTISERFHLLQKKALTIILFHGRNYGTGPLFRAFNIRNYFDKNALGNCIFVSQSLKGLLLSVCSSLFKSAFESHSHDTRWANLA